MIAHRPLLSSLFRTLQLDAPVFACPSRDLDARPQFAAIAALFRQMRGKGGLRR
jgi:hypothetical protein